MDMIGGGLFDKKSLFYRFVAKKYNDTMIKPAKINVRKQVSATDRLKPAFA